MKSQSETLAVGVGETEMELDNSVKETDAILSDGVETEVEGEMEAAEEENGTRRFSELETRN